MIFETFTQFINENTVYFHIGNGDYGFQKDIDRSRIEELISSSMLDRDKSFSDKDGFTDYEAEEEYRRDIENKAKEIANNDKKLTKELLSKKYIFFKNKYVIPESFSDLSIAIKDDLGYTTKQKINKSAVISNKKDIKRAVEYIINRIK